MTALHLPIDAARCSVCGFIIPLTEDESAIEAQQAYLDACGWRIVEGQDICPVCVIHADAPWEQLALL